MNGDIWLALWGPLEESSRYYVLNSSKMPKKKLRIKKNGETKLTLLIASSIAAASKKVIIA